MARIKTGPYRRQRHNKVLKMTKGQFGTRHRLFRRANEEMLKRLWYSYRDRRQRRRDLRRLWIARINAGARANGISNPNFIRIGRRLVIPSAGGGGGAAWADYGFDARIDRDHRGFSP